MKTRTGFVSNSSSSSFLLSKPTSDRMVVIPAETKELPAIKIETLEELSDYFNTIYWGFGWQESKEAIYDKMKPPVFLVICRQTREDIPTYREKCRIR